MSSYSTEANQQQQYFTPGWNDPPALGVSTGQPATPSQLSSQRKRRPLDPSVQQDLGQNFGNGSVGSYGGSNMQHGAGSPIHYQQPAMQQHNPQQHHQQQYNQPAFNHNYGQQAVGMGGQAAGISVHPQQPSHAPLLPQMTQPTPQQLSTHPASAFTPTVPTNLAAANPTYHGFTNEVSSSFSSQPQQQHVNPAAQQHQLPAAGNPHPQISGPLGAIHPSYSHPQVMQAEQSARHNTSDTSTAIQREVAFQAYSPPSSNQMRNYEDPSSLIFSPPNTVNFSDQRPATQPDPSTYIAPTKAAGDVSLSGPQLVSFLIKATIRLPQGPMREGIQLKIGQLNDLVMAGQLSESCLKKLNFVVDAVDRGAYEEAWQFFEQLQMNFPDEMSNGAKWTQGLKFLILELKKQKYGGGGVQLYQNENQQQIRAGSAGTRMM